MTEPKAKLFVATPMYGGMCTGHYVAGLLGTLNKMRSVGVPVYWAQIMNESLITRARKYLSGEDTGKRITGTAPPPGGTRLAVLEIQPGNTLHGLHHTDTIDYVICMAGEIEMELDDSTVKMKAGDVLIQRGTNHGWVNRSDAPARIAVMLTDAQPKRGDSVAGTQNAR